MKNYKIRTLFTITLLIIAWSATLPQVKAVLWSDDTQFTTASSLDMAPAMTQTTDKRIWMFWHSNILSADFFDIFYNYTYDGITWSQAFQLTTYSSNDGDPAVITTQDGKMWVFWVTDRDGPPGNWEIYYKKSSNNGASWSSDYPLTQFPAKDSCPSVMQAHDGKIWVVWESDRFGDNYDLWYNIYDGGWGIETQLTNDTYNDKQPSIIQDDSGKIWVFWASKRNGNYALYYKTTIDYGVNWSTETQLTDPQNKWDQLPSAIQAHDGEIWVVWERGKAGQNFDIYYMTYDDFTWSSDDGIVTHNLDDRQPTIFQAENTTLWIAWHSSRLDDYDIFYKTTLNEHDVAVTNVTPTTYAYQGYESTIKVTVKNYGMHSETFNVTAYHYSTPIGNATVSDLAPNAPTTLTFNWNTTDLSLGYYTNIFSATASTVPNEEDLTDNSLTNGTVLVTIPGDVNGDKKVDMLDKGAISSHWYPGPPLGPLDYAEVADINNDGAVDMADLAIMSAHWGESW